MMYTARELQAYFKSGLLLVGQGEDGAFEWMGEARQFAEAERRLALSYEHERWHEQ